MNLIKPKILAAILLTLICSTANAQQIRYSILVPDIGMTRLDRNGRAVVVMNPIAMRRVGPQVSEFFLQHELGHIRGGHLYQRNRPTWQLEREADRIAVSNVSPQVRQAAANYLYRKNHYNRLHGTGRQRATRLLRY